MNMTNEKLKEIDNYCSLCMDINCDGCEYQDIHFRDLPYYKPKNKNKMKTGIELIAEERQRQIDVEGYTAQHDSQHNASDFVYAAISYAESAKVGVNCMEIGDTNENEIMFRKIEMGKSYPFGWDFKPSTNIRDLVKAGALIAAAIDRLQMKKL